MKRDRFVHDPGAGFLKRQALSILRFLVSAALIMVAFLNLWHANRLAEARKPRNQDDVVVLEHRMIAIRNALLGVGYRGGDLGYMPAGVLNGNPRTEQESARWAQARYVMIPWNLLQDSTSAPYVIVDASLNADQPRLPERFVKLYDSGDGLILLQQTHPQ
jgi:hypothetical protein